VIAGPSAERPRRRRRLPVVLSVLFLLATLGPGAGVATAGERGWTLDEISRELMCPQCELRLDLSTGPAADRVRVFVETRRAQGWTKAEVKDALVAEYGRRVLAAPPRSGFGGLAWLVPAAIGLGGVALTVLALVVLRRREPPSGGLRSAVAQGVDPDAERRLDDALRRFEP
jgi:cytochrome c-type biogenesis protein CcmH/NrfF